jgi:choline dehydrogenase-like flavoprotein
MSHTDPILQGLQRGWKVLGGQRAPLPQRIECDVAIIGSGAGAGITAELLTKAGLNVVIVEEGQLKSSTDFKQREPEAYASLYPRSGWPQNQGQRHHHLARPQRGRHHHRQLDQLF